MRNTLNHEDYNVDFYDYENDFQILTNKEKRGVLRNAKTFLKLQKENKFFLEMPFFNDEKK